jgi:hypothetical protein
LSSTGYLLFDIYDLDHSQTFEFDEVRLLISELCDGILLSNSDAKLSVFPPLPLPPSSDDDLRVNERLDELNYLAVSPDTFVGLCRTYPAILTPLRNAQQTLRSFFKISKDFWERQTRNRQMMTDSESGHLSLPLLSLLSPRTSLTISEMFPQICSSGAPLRPTGSHLEDHALPGDESGSRSSEERKVRMRKGFVAILV